MRCINCNNVIPEASIKCPYCGSEIDPTKVQVKVDTSIENVDDLNFNDKIDLMKYIKEPKNKKNVLIFGGIILFLLIVLAALILLVFSGGKKVNFYRAIVNKVSDYLDDNYLGNNMIGTGGYTLNYSINGDGNLLSGNYGYDIKNKIGILSGTIENPNLAKGQIVLDAKSFNYNLYLKNNELYGLFSDLYDKYILFPIDDKSGLLATKNYDISSIIHGVLNALDEVTQNINSSNEGSVTIDYRGEKTKATKETLLLDNSNKTKLYKMFYESLIEDANFLNECARISGKKSEDIKQTLQNEITNIEYRFSGNSDKETKINVYYSGSELYRLEIDRIKEEENDLIYLDIGETKYYLTYNKDNQKVMYATLSVLSKEVQDIINKTIELNVDIDDIKISIVLKLQKDMKPLLKKTDVQESKNIRDLTLEEITSIKDLLISYIDETTIVDEIIGLFKNKCNPELNCDCPLGSNTCNCLYNQEIITCTVDDVKKNVE